MNAECRKSKILLVTFSNNADHQDTLFGLYEEMSRMDSADVVLCCTETPKVPLQKSESTWTVKCPPHPGICRQTFNLKELCRIIGLIKKNKIDVIYFESLHIWNLAILIYAKFKKRIRVCHAIHDIVPHESGLYGKLVSAMNWSICRLSDFIIIRNRIYKSILSKKYHISEDRITVFDLWRRFPDFTEPSYSKKVLFFGRISPYKGAENLLKIIKKCPEIQFRVVGRADKKSIDIIDAIREESNVEIINEYISDEQMINEYKCSDVVIVPYNSASQSGVIVDAYKYSRPVVAFDVGAISEQIDDAKSGFLVKEKDIDAFTVAIRKIISMTNDDFYELCKSAFEFGSIKYSVKNAAPEFSKYINKMII